MAKAEFKKGTVLGLMKGDGGWFGDVVNSLLRRRVNKGKYYEGLVDKNGD